MRKSLIVEKGPTLVKITISLIVKSHTLEKLKENRVQRELHEESMFMREKWWEFGWCKTCVGNQVHHEND